MPVFKRCIITTISCIVVTVEGVVRWLTIVVRGFDALPITYTLWLGGEEIGLIRVGIDIAAHVPLDVSAVPMAYIAGGVFPKE